LRANRIPQWLRAALYPVRDHHEALLRPLKLSLTTEPDRFGEAAPEEQRILVRHLGDDYCPMFLDGIVSGIHEMGPRTLQCADRFQAADHIVRPDDIAAHVGKPKHWPISKIEILRSSLVNAPRCFHLHCPP
jgi:hypothetical protein